MFCYILSLLLSFPPVCQSIFFPKLLKRYLKILWPFTPKHWSQGEGPRWWHRRLLNVPPPTDSQNVRLRTEQLPLERNPETSWVTPTHRAKWENPHSKWVGKAEKHSHDEPHPQYSTTQLEGNPQLPASPWGAEGLDHTSSAHTFKAPKPRMGPHNT